MLITEGREQLVELAGKWNALPLVVWLLGKDNIPLSPDQLALHRQQYLGNYLKNTLLVRELGTVLGALAARNVECIVLKGAAFLTNFYPDLGLRPVRDIDLLVRREQIPIVIEVLLGCWYRPFGSTAGSDSRGQVTYVKDGEPPIGIEPHWRLGSSFSYAGRITVEGVWQRAEKLDVAGADALALSPEDSLLHLCLHLFQHNTDSWLVPCCDMAALTRRQKVGIDWELFLSRAFEYKVCVPVEFSLRKTVELLGSPVPEFVIDRLSRYGLNGFERKYISLLTGPLYKDNRDVIDIFSLMVNGRNSLKPGFIKDMLFPAAKDISIKYDVGQPLLLPVYYLRRLVSYCLLALRMLLDIVFLTRR